MKFLTLQPQKYLSIFLSDTPLNNLSLFLPNIDSLILSQIFNNFVTRINEKHFYSTTFHLRFALLHQFIFSTIFQINRNKKVFSKIIRSHFFMLKPTNNYGRMCSKSFSKYIIFLPIPLLLQEQIYVFHCLYIHHIFVVN